MSTSPWPAALLLSWMVLGCQAPTAAAPEPSAPAPAPPPPPAAPAPREKTKVHFDWPVPARVTVTQRLESDAHRSTIRYVVTMTRPTADGPLEVRFGQFTVVDIDGLDAQSPALHGPATDLLDAASMMPPVIVSSEGKYLGVNGIDEVIEKLIAKNRAGKAPSQLAEADRMMRLPEVKAKLEAQSGDFWRTWVELWKDLDLAPGEKRGRKNGAVSAVYEHQGSLPEEPGLVRLSLKTVTEGQAAMAESAPFLGTIMRRLKLKNMPQLDGVRRELRVSADTDPLTLKPRKVRVERRTEVTLSGLPAQSEQVVNEYTFDWSGGS